MLSIRRQTVRADFPQECPPDQAENLHLQRYGQRRGQRYRLRRWFTSRATGCRVHSCICVMFSMSAHGKIASQAAPDWPDPIRNRHLDVIAFRQARHKHRWQTPYKSLMIRDGSEDCYSGRNGTRYTGVHSTSVDARNIPACARGITGMSGPGEKSRGVRRSGGHRVPAADLLMREWLHPSNRLLPKRARIDLGRYHRESAGTSTSHARRSKPLSIGSDLHLETSWRCNLSRRRCGVSHFVLFHMPRHHHVRDSKDFRTCVCACFSANGVWSRRCCSLR